MGLIPTSFPWLPSELPGTAFAHRLTGGSLEEITSWWSKESGEVVVERGADKKWKLVEPSQGILDNDALQHLLDEWGALRAEQFHPRGPRQPGEYGLDQPEVTITATAGDRTYSLALASCRAPTAGTRCGASRHWSSRFGPAAPIR